MNALKISACHESSTEQLGRARLSLLRENTHHPFVHPSDECYYLWDYSSGGGYSNGATNALILDLKTSPLYSTDRERWRKKCQAIAFCARTVRDAIRDPDLSHCTWVPVPPSHVRGSAGHDSRLSDILSSITTPLDFRELVIQRQDTISKAKGISPEERARIWLIDETLCEPEPEQIVVFDDLLTSGSHFRAMHSLLSRRFPSARVIGVFLARRVAAECTDAGMFAARKVLIRLGRQTTDQVSSDAVTALVANDPPTIFRQMGMLVRLRRRENDRVQQSRSKIELLTESMLKSVLLRCAEFRLKGKVCDPPARVVKDILAMPPSSKIPCLTGIVETPVLRPNGKILGSPGYDKTTGLFLDIREGEIKIDDRPSREQLRRAVCVLTEDCLGDFPFDSPSSEANALALLLTPFLRFATGCAPLAIIDAPQPGTGKSLLASVIGIIATGREIACGTAPTQECEWRKSITATLLSGQSMVLLDNVDDVLDSSSLSAVLTSAVWRDRLLGQSRELEVLNLATWIATGNNVRIGGDLPRRCYRIRLDARRRDPQFRTGFRHPHILDWVREHRTALVRAVLTLIQSYYSTGCPEGPDVSWGSFEAWSKAVAGILDNAGVHGFLQDVVRRESEVDVDSEEWQAFYCAIAERFGTEGFDTRELWAAMSDRLIDILPSRVGASAGEIAKKFRQYLGRRFGESGARIERIADGDGKFRWTVRFDRARRQNQ